jgi:hypothetical protein
MSNENGLVEPAKPMWQPAVVCIAASLCKRQSGQWTLPDPTERYGRDWDGWADSRGGALELPPIADPDAKATLPKTNLDEMHARGHLTGTEYAIALAFQTTPCGASVVKGYYAIVIGVVLHGKTAGEIADPRVGRSKGIEEVMCKLRLGLRLMADHYFPPEEEPDENRLDLDTFRQTYVYKFLKERERSADDPDPRRGYFEFVPPKTEKDGLVSFGTESHYSTYYSKEFSHCGSSAPADEYTDGLRERLYPTSVDAHISAWCSRRPEGDYGARSGRTLLGKQMWSAQMRRGSMVTQAGRSMSKTRIGKDD